MFAAIVGQSWATAAHPYNLEVNGVDWIDSVRHSSIRIEMPGPGSNGSMSVDLWDPDYSISITEWDEVRFIEHAATRPILFGGFVQSVRYVAHKGLAGGRTIQVQCVGYGIMLDKKVCPETTLPFDLDIDSQVQRLVSLYGGLVTAQIAATFQSPDEDAGIPNYSVVTNGRWMRDYYAGQTLTVAPGPTYLRGTIEYLLGVALSEADVFAFSYITIVGVPGIFWVDSARMFRLLADGSGSTLAIWAPGGADYDGQYDGGVPGLAIAAGTHRIEHIEYEREDTDRATSAYVQGSDEVTHYSTLTADANRFVASANMRIGTYTVANTAPTWALGFVVTITHTSAGAPDTLGRVVVRGYDLYGQRQKEAITPVADKKTTGSAVWSRITTITGRGWEADGATDNIVVGHAAQAYVVNQGTGYYRTPGTSRAGDLEVLLTDGESTSLEQVTSKGSAAVSATTSATARGSVVIADDGPLSVWPGRHLTVDFAAVGLSSSQVWRATSVRIEFRSSTERTYEIGFGGSVPRPSFARRMRRKLEPPWSATLSA